MVEVLRRSQMVAGMRVVMVMVIVAMWEEGVL